MNQRFKHKWKRVLTGTLGVIMAAAALLGSASTAFAAEEPNPQPPANGEKIYSVDPFDSAHSAGYFCVKDSDGYGVTYYDGEDGEWVGWRGSNDARSSKIYIDHHDGACFNGTYFDIREYVWQEDCSYYAIRNNGSVAAKGTEDGRVFREFHFYESGTLNSSNPVEVEWKGVMRLTDMDIEEGYTFIQGLHAAWLNNPTNVTKRDSKTWRGTWENNNDGVNSEREMLWVEVEGSPSKPLTIAYWCNKSHASAVNYYGNTIKYELVPDGKDPLPADAKPAVGVHCATYAKYDLMPEDEFIRYEFDGWYYDKDLTKKVPDTIMVAEDHTFYGTYHKVAGLIVTDVEHGSITPTDECVPYGNDKVIEYSPEEGYLLESVTVDGSKVNINDYPDTFTFANVQSDHEIKAVYVKANMDKAEYIKDSDFLDSYKDGSEIDGMVLKEGDVVTYTISYENPTGAARTIVIKDTVPNGAEAAAESITDGGILADGVITWTIAAEAYSKGQVSFNAKITEDAKGSIVKNTADVTFKALTPDGSEKDVTMTDTVTSPILDDPAKSTVNADGADITNKIVNNGAVLTYLITFTNPAEETKTFTVTDVIPEGVTYAEGSISDGGSVSDGKAVWQLDLAAGETKTVSVSISVNDPKAPLTKIYNQADVRVDNTTKKTETTDRTNPDDPRTPNYVLDDPEKTILNADGKNISRDGNGNAIQTVKAAGDQIVYRISFANPADDERTFTVTDVLPEGVKFISATGDYQYDEGSRTITWTAAVSGNKSAYVDATVEIEKSAEDTILKNQAHVSVDDAGKDTNIVETPVLPTPEKDVFSKLGEASINTFPVQIGENIFYTVSFKNPADVAKTAVITDKLPEGVKFVSASDNCSYDAASHTVTWNILTDAHTEGTVSVKVKVTQSAYDTELNNQARVGMDEANVTSITKNGPDEDEATTNYVSGKSVVNAEGVDIDKDVVAVGDVVTYRINYQNHSHNTRMVTIKDVLPQDVLYMAASEGGNVQSIVHGQTVIWMLEVAPKTDGYVWVSVKVTDALKGMAFANSATVEMSDPETEQSKITTTNQVINYVMDDVVKHVLSDNGKKDLEGEKVKGGKKLLYTITFSNPNVEAKEFTITDVIPEDVEFLSVNDDGTYDEAAGTVSWKVTLEPGKSATVSFLVKVIKKAECDFIQNVADVHVDETDAKSNPVKVYVKGDKSTDTSETEKPADEKPSDDQKPDDTKPSDDQKQDETKPADDQKQEETKPADDNKQEETAPADDTKKDTSDDKKDTFTNPSSSDDGKGQSSSPESDGKGQSTSTNAPKTGDESNVGLWLILMLLAGGSACGLGGYALYKGRKKED